MLDGRLQYIRVLQKQIKETTDPEEKASLTQYLAYRTANYLRYKPKGI